MKKLIKFVLFAAAAGAIAYFCKDRLIPSPEGPIEDPPHFRVPPPHSTEVSDAAASPADDLTAVKGIGPVYSHRLTEAGIGTFAALAAADTAAVADATGITPDQAVDWIRQAGELAG